MARLPARMQTTALRGYAHGGDERRGYGRGGDERRGEELRADERGFALMTVLVVIAVTAIIFGALLGLMLLTIKITNNHQKIERERRAADGAVTATLNHLRLATPGSGCATVPDALPGYEVQFDLPEASDQVQVTCQAGAGDYAEPGGELKIVGDRYSGTLTDWRTAWPWSQAPGGVLAALGVSGVDPSLVHVGPEPLRFNGNVNTVAGAAALRDPTDGTPAIEVRGQYRQAAPGIGATGTDCGFLGQVGSPLFIDAVADISCGDASALSEANPADYAIDPTIPVLPAVATGGCPAGPVVTFTAGRYDRQAVATLNGWFDGSCPNRTFHFPSGVYWFDAAEPTRPAGERNALIIDDDTSSFVFGEANGWSTSTGATPVNFPDACRTGVSAGSPGGSIVLSGRTSLLHRGGRLAVCPYVSPASEPYPAILQQRTVPTAIVVSAGAEKDFAPAANLVSGDATHPTDPLTMNCTTTPGSSTCKSKKDFEVVLSTSGGPEPLKGLRLTLVGDEPNYPVSALKARLTSVTIRLADGTNCATTEAKGAPIGGRETAYDLLTGTCATAGLTAQRLDGATLAVTIRYNYDALAHALAGYPYQRLQIWDVRVQADTVVASATSVNTAASTSWDAVGNVLVDNPNQRSRMILACGPGKTVCDASPTDIVGLAAGEKAFTIDGVSLGGAMDPTDRIDTMGVLVKQAGSQAIQAGGLDIGNLFLDGTTRITVTLADGRQCTKEFSGVVNREGDTYYPLMTSGSSLCGELPLAPEESIASLLDNASITVGMTLGYYCEWLGTNRWCAFVRPVPIHYVGLTATTSSYKGAVTQSVLTVNSTETGAGSSANFFGAGHLPNSSLDLLWNGRASGRSIFGGELQLNSLGSRMEPVAQADVVCCTKPELSAFEVRLTAHVAGRPVLSVVAVLAPDRDMPEILEWTQCGRNGTCGPPN